MNDDRSIVIAGTDWQIPDGVESLGEGDLYKVPFDLLVVAEASAAVDAYEWENPRRYGQSGDSAGRGFNQADMQELYVDIRDDGLMLPLVCRWVIDTDEKMVIQILDGERRWRCMNRQIEKGDNVWSRKDRAFLPANVVHGKIPCRIIAGNDKEALKIAFMVSDRQVGWGEGATAKLVKKLRGCNCSDEEILELTKKSGQWLREMDRICQLDELTFSYLADAKINRALALKLSDIEDLDRRHNYLHASYDDAVSTNGVVVAKADEALEKAILKEEQAEAELQEAVERGVDVEEIAEAEAKLEEAKTTTNERQRKRSGAARPQAGTKNLRNVHAQKIGEENPEQIDEIAQPLRPGKMRKHAEELKEIIQEGHTSREVLPLPYCQVLLHYINNCALGGEEDIRKFLKRQRHLLILQKKRKAEK